jgi:UTP pyrophosphatase
MSPIPQLAGYPAELQAQAEALLKSGELGNRLLKLYPESHKIHSSKDLHDYTQELKARYMRNAAPLSKVTYDSKLRTVSQALGLHLTAQRIHGSRMNKRREIRIATVFKDAPAPFLRMIVVHELAHMKHADHDANFYRLCCNMEPNYHQLEFDLRLYLCTLESPNTEG